MSLTSFNPYNFCPVLRYHLFGNVLTNYGSAANNRGESEGNVAQLQKIIWKGEVHTTVSAEAIRWELRYYWQQMGFSVNRRWDERTQGFSLINPDFDPEALIDDDVLGFMRAEAARIDNSDTAPKPYRKGKNQPKGTKVARRGALDFTRAVSTIPYFGETLFSARSGEKNNTSIYVTEFHATRYQYGFALTPEYLEDKSRVLPILDGIASLSRVAGNHARFLYDFSPEVIVLRWTQDFSPRFLYCFEENENHNISIPTLIHKISSGDLKPEELWFGGHILGESLKEWGVHVFPGVKAAVEAMKAQVMKDLQIQKA